MDENLKAQLQELMSYPFQPRMMNGNYDKKAYQLAMKNTKYNNEGKVVVYKFGKHSQLYESKKQ